MKVKDITVSQTIRLSRKSRDDFYTIEASGSVTATPEDGESSEMVSGELQKFVNQIVKKDMQDAAVNIKTSVTPRAES